MTTKRFVLRKTLIGKNTVIEFTNKKGETRKYNHDVVFKANKAKLEAMPCWEKYSTYTCTNNLPVILRDKKLV